MDVKTDLEPHCPYMPEWPVSRYTFITSNIIFHDLIIIKVSNVCVWSGVVVVVVSFLITSHGHRHGHYSDAQLIACGISE